MEKKMNKELKIRVNDMIACSGYDDATIGEQIKEYCSKWDISQEARNELRKGLIIGKSNKDGRLRR